MNFPLIQLYSMNRSKPIVGVEGIDGMLQWDYCDLEELPPEVVGKTVHDMGTIPKGQYENLPKTFYAINGGEYFIENIHTLRPSKYSIYKHRDARDESNYLGFDDGGEG